MAKMKRKRNQKDEPAVKKSQGEELAVENEQEMKMVKKNKGIEIKKSRTDELIVQQNQDENLMVERCNLHSRLELSVYAIAYSEEFKRLCVIRKMERDGVIGINNLTIVEFYNASNPPLIFFEKGIPLFESLESCIWINNWIVTGGLSGMLYFFSPFTSRFKRTQVSITEITSIAQFDSEHFVITNNSAELMIFSKQEELDDDNSSTLPMFTNQKSIKFPTDRHLISLACTERNQKQKFVAVGMVNWISIIKFKKGKFLEEERNDIQIPHTKSNAILICSLLFVDNYLLTGDSKGQVTIYDAETGLLIKTFKSHLNNVLALATDGKQVFASGDDCRIQIISRTGTRKEGFDWQQTGQRVFHTNDVRSLCTINAEWLVSGGYEGFYVSGKHTICKPQLRPECSFSNANGLLALRKLLNIDIWLKPRNEGLSVHENFKEFSSKLLVRIESSTIGIIKQISLSPNGTFLCISGNLNGAISILKVNEDLVKKLNESRRRSRRKEFEEIESPIELFWTNQNNEEKKAQKVEGGRTVTAIYCTDRHLYYAIGEFALFRIDLSTKELQPIAIQSNRGCLLKICTNPSETMILAITNSGSALLFKDDSFQNLETLNFQEDVPYDCIFVDDNRVAFLMSDLKTHFVIFDTTTQQFMVKSAEQLGFCETEWIAYLANSGNQLFATTNKGRIISINAGEQQELEIFIMDLKSDLKTMAKCKDIRNEAFIGNVEEQNQKKSIVLVGHVDAIAKI